MESLRLYGGDESVKRKGSPGRKKAGSVVMTCLLLALGTLFLCWFFVLRQGVFGSQIDWISQHSVLPDYFRKLFYETGNLFPDFAPGLGGGQNIYHFSYYGLYSPVILFSYLLPFVRMSDYVMVSSFFCYSLSVILFYLWVHGKCERNRDAAVAAGMFALSTTLLYQSYNQLMFVNYMPFLCLALIGTDRYLEGKRGRLLMIAAFGMIMTSFYFSIGGLMVLVLYGSSEYFQREKQLTWPGFWKCGGGFLVRLFVAVLMSCFLLVPTACSLGGSRKNGAEASVSWLLPELKLSRLLYSPYGLGLSVLILVVLLSGLGYRTWREKILSLELLLLLTVPVFGYLLNGGLYSKDKVFIPCLPVLCYLIIPYIKHIDNIRKKYRYWCIPYLAVIVLVFLKREEQGIRNYWPFVLFDAILMLAVFLLCCKKKKVWLLPVAACVSLFVTGYGINQRAEMMVQEDFYREVTSDKLIDSLMAAEEKTEVFRTEQLGDGAENKANINRVHDISQYLTSIYSSSYNEAYQEFRKNTFGLNEPYRNDMMQSVTDNPCFLQFMGVRYLAAGEKVAGYESLAETGGKVSGEGLWENEAALPVVYATSQTISEETYKKLQFPQNQTALLQAAVVKGADGESSQGEAALEEVLTPTDFSLEAIQQKGLEITNTGEKEYEIHAKEDTVIEADIGEEVSNGETGENTKRCNLFALSFTVENLNPHQDMEITVNGQKNKLTDASHEYANENTTFTYLVTLEEGSSKVSLTFGTGDYRIKNVEAYAGDYEKLKETGLCQKPLECTDKWTDGSSLSGTVVTEEDGWLVTSIPYEKDFTIQVDGKNVDTEVVNTAFLGCRLEKGSHMITISYRARGFEAGVLLSLFGCLGFLFFLFSFPFVTIGKRK